MTHFYPPEPCAAANRIAALVQALEAHNFIVHVVAAAPSFPTGVIARSDRVIWPRTVRDGKVRITRVWTFASQILSARNRMLNWLSVALSMSLYVLTLRCRYDFVVATMPPITLALPAYCAKLRHRARLIADVRDVYPDVAIAMGYWAKKSLTSRIVALISSSTYRAAHLVLCVTESARREIVARGSDPAKTVVAVNGFDSVSSAPESPYQRLTGEFIAAFIGNMGLATGLDVIIDAATHLRDESRIRFVLAGGGADKDRLVARIVAEHLDNVTMLGVVPRDQANALIADADVSVVPLHRSIVDSLPTKIFDAFAFKRAVICCADGEARALMERSGGGIALPPEDGAALANALRKLSKEPALLAACAARGHAYVLEHYDRSQVMRAVAARLATIT